MQIVIDIPECFYEYCKAQEDAIEVQLAIKNGTPLPKCNQCKYYGGVHNVQGHAPCEYHKIGGVLWNWYCSQFEADKDYRR